ncbi:unnamed protein product [Coffea canephora]|uniref:DH200=94 genomic scaffold, scaffold_610 n=1 Tax=Coffea canephora TaxID=49390 RepID=A0A068VGJ7_COFCA|nr:unnamed protein product [Coffea canephora]
MKISNFGHLRHIAEENAILDVTIQLKQDLFQQGIIGLSKCKDSKSEPSMLFPVELCDIKDKSNSHQ